MVPTRNLAVTGNQRGVIRENTVKRNDARRKASLAVKGVPPRILGMSELGKLVTGHGTVGFENSVDNNLILSGKRKGVTIDIGNHNGPAAAMSPGYLIYNGTVLPGTNLLVKERPVLSNQTPGLAIKQQLLQLKAAQAPPFVKNIRRHIDSLAHCDLLSSLTLWYPLAWTKDPANSKPRKQGTAGHDFTFEFTASGTYRIYFYFMDNDRNDPQNDKGIYYLRTTAEVTVNDAARPSVTQIVNDAVALCRQQTNGSEYDMALWLHDWTLDQLEYDHSLNWCSAESGLTRHQGTCESYQRIYSKLLDAAGIANGRITGNGHTWNAVKIDGKWCQMDLTWDDTSDNWYGDLDQRHLYFGLTDELMAIAHSDHAANYQKADCAYRSTDLSNNYFVRNGKADEWAEKYADRIQQHLDAKEESFSIEADIQSFPPSISAIQNGIAAYAMNRREWIVQDAKVELTVTSNVTAQSSSKWSAIYIFEARYASITPKGWLLENGIWYYLNANGTYATGWRTIDGSRYYFEDDGAMATGWHKEDGSLYFLTGALARKGWLLVNGTWFYIDDDRTAAVGWRDIEGERYLFDDDGAMATGWQEVSGKRYYLTESGRLAPSGWMLLEGAWYYVQADGSIATDCWIGSYYVDKTGKWIPAAQK